MQNPECQTTVIPRPYQPPKLERQGVWQIATGVTLSIGGNLISSELEVKL